jgi:hypothetical protein
VLEDLLDAMNHALTFTLEEYPLTDNDVAASVGALLADDCWVDALEPVASWAELTREAPPGLFIPSRACGGIDPVARRHVDWPKRSPTGPSRCCAGCGPRTLTRGPSLLNAACCDAMGPVLGQPGGYR